MIVNFKWKKQQKKNQLLSFNKTEYQEQLNSCKRKTYAKPKFLKCHLFLNYCLLDSKFKMEVFMLYHFKLVSQGAGYIIM